METKRARLSAMLADPTYAPAEDQALIGAALAELPPLLRTRLRAILCSLWFGLLPWWVYEPECHYRPWSWWQHLLHNLRHAWTWAAGAETSADRAFEARVNARPNWFHWCGQRVLTDEATAAGNGRVR